jgi:hypothetical protein
VHLEGFDDVRKAIDREKQLKDWRRAASRGVPSLLGTGVRRTCAAGHPTIHNSSALRLKKRLLRFVSIPASNGSFDSFGCRLTSLWMTSWGETAKVQLRVPIANC